ncbi:hypothetical protein SAMN05421869_105325 [Nonomuraea jiangxiensis]|uniref:WYL domain-containing protein n=1 Tax=Nonomuraea jiangxiensis TaxID=633440 RepID=A0A1G8KB57_9ACTN|nr:hypothetical protein SAMN05421869_105325 [Nonomuraea jiangxiensis]
MTGIEETSLRALAKLEQVLPARLRHRVNAVQTHTVRIDREGPTVDADLLSRVAAACRDHEQLRFDYTDHHGECASRKAEPHSLVSRGNFEVLAPVELKESLRALGKRLAWL